MALAWCRGERGLPTMGEIATMAEKCELIVNMMKHSAEIVPKFRTNATMQREIRRYNNLLEECDEILAGKTPISARLQSIMDQVRNTTVWTVRHYIIFQPSVQYPEDWGEDVQKTIDAWRALIDIIREF